MQLRLRTAFLDKERLLSYLKADERTRTVNLLITNQLLCQLSHIGIYSFKIHTSVNSLLRAPRKLCFLGRGKIAYRM